MFLCLKYLLIREGRRRFKNFKVMQNFRPRNALEQIIWKSVLTKSTEIKTCQIQLLYDSMFHRKFHALSPNQKSAKFGVKYFWRLSNEILVGIIKNCVRRLVQLAKFLPTRGSSNNPKIHILRKNVSQQLSSSFKMYF